MDYEQFQLVHSHLLKQVPPLYWETLYRKLTKEEYDAGNYFMMIPLIGGPRGRGQYEVVVSAEGGLQQDSEW
jgi:hypothetical protein